MNRAGRRANGERGRFKDPVNKRRSEPVGARAADDACSWLGQWSGVGWSIRIEPKLTRAQWDQYTPRAEECWSETARNYDPLKTLELLASLFPTHQCSVMWPRCGKRLDAGGIKQGDKIVKPFYALCGAVARHTETHIRDAYDNKVAIARCDEHRGQL